MPKPTRPTQLTMLLEAEPERPPALSSAMHAEVARLMGRLLLKLVEPTGEVERGSHDSNG